MAVEMRSVFIQQQCRAPEVFVLLLESRGRRAGSFCAVDKPDIVSTKMNSYFFDVLKIKI